jgi:hypothetical protein
MFNQSLTRTASLCARSRLLMLVRLRVFSSHPALPLHFGKEM